MGMDWEKMDPRQLAPIREVQEREQGKHSRFYIATVGKLVDPYIPSATKGSMWDGMKRYQKRFFAQREIKRCLPDFSLKNFAKEAANVYTAYHKAYYTGDLNALKESLTEIIFSQKKAKAKKFKMDRSERHSTSPVFIEWHASDVVAEPLGIVHVPLGVDDIEFAQISVRFTSLQHLQVLNKNGEVLKTQEPRSIVEYWVLERLITQPGTVWRLAGKVEPTE
eukprot:CAMPEP_0174233188 /NCGR_PEP_ID=MMETSP0417-20130205/3291_1 /TAXON_ID=242541 /ORGANISM="Mayorella sp, Strain BSH-02190019" /LENGTH=221 /DNA_ID=CAMNT_0015311357 /DNA_START=269 /DNA_END=934 /DNA_ORIENTATION=-